LDALGPLWAVPAREPSFVVIDSLHLVLAHACALAKPQKSP
jgi:hypothetical protein